MSTKIFLSYAECDEARQDFIEAVLTQSFVHGSWGDTRSTAEDQTILVKAFGDAVGAWREPVTSANKSE